jgi:phosphopantetheinyl transferase
VLHVLDDLVLATHRLDAEVPASALRPGEQGLVDAAQGDHRRRELAAGRAAARLAFAAAGAPPHLQVLADAKGRPVVEPPGPWHVSIAHDGALAAAAVSLAPVGVDLIPLARAEAARKVVERRISTGRARPLAVASARPFDEALLLWTAWEALGKRTGGGVLSGVMDEPLCVDASGEHPAASAGGVRLRWLLVDGHLCCVARAGPA